ncbi:hypothetical protein JRQ81_014809 [Phrynocephalus forsythii]|uniref:Uncharacterized protein n=1 Tax=Phrynocephalus forsythii TaxID=171643 RepID=A0A9Q0XXE7_9SAUR|nr:hypothetical protein JRQ81_014809 [Phrynocephalus forsythii]
MPRRTDNLYCTHGEDTIFLAQHPPPNSLIVNASQNRAKNTSTSVPSNKEGRKLDLIGKKQYSLASFSLRTSNHLCAMDIYTRHLLFKMPTLFEQLPDDARAKLSSYHKEILSLMDYQAIAATHMADAAAHQLANAVFLRRHAWLRTATITDVAHNRIEGAPFEGEGLFAATTDESLENILKMRKTACSYSYQGSSSQPSSHPGPSQWRRPYTSAGPRPQQCPWQSYQQSHYYCSTQPPRPRATQSGRRYDHKPKHSS